MFNMTFQEYKEWVHDMAGKGIPDAILDKGLSDEVLMSQFAYEQIWNGLQCGFTVPISSIKSINDDILKKLDIIVDGEKVTYKDVDTNEWIKAKF